MVCLKVLGGISKDHFTNDLSTMKIPLQWRGLEETLIQMMKFSITNNGTN